MKIKARHDLFKLQTASSPDIFKNLRKLLLEKWNKNKNVTSCFSSFFKVQGTESTENWYEGYHPLKTVHLIIISFRIKSNSKCEHKHNNKV